MGHTRVVPFDRIVEGNNIRQTYLGIEELAASIAELGVIHDLTVRWRRGNKPDEDRFEIADGHRRYRAIKMIRERNQGAFKDVKIDILDGTDTDAVLVMLDASLKTKSLSPGEIAIGLQRLVNLRLDQASIARRLSLTPGYVSSLLRCRNGLIEPLFARLTDRRLPVDTAVRLVGQSAEDQEAALKLMEEAEVVTAVLETSGQNGVTGEHVDPEPETAPPDLAAAAKRARKVARAVTSAVVGTVRPSVKELKAELVKWGDKDKPFAAGVRAALGFALGKKKAIRETP